VTNENIKFDKPDNNASSLALQLLTGLSRVCH